jgi:monofunctional biosynthetic peptidoglycan transglycosylase
MNDGSAQAEPHEQLPGAGRWKKLLVWVREHKTKTAFLVVSLFILYEILTIPYFSIAKLRTENPTQTALMRQRLHEAEKQGKPLRIVHKWVPLSRISRNVIDAVIVAEDGSFYSHNGVDWFEVKESIEKNMDQLRAARGASTITQQLAKNLYLSTSKDPVRKLKELIITFFLEWTLSKNRILEIYLNVIEWGRGVFGIEAAAEKYFDTSAASLTLEQATRLASVIPSPLRHRPDDDSRYVLRRKGIVLRRMEARNMANQPQTTEESPTSQRPDYQPVTIAPPDTTVPVDSMDSEEDENNGL